MFSSIKEVRAILKDILSDPRGEPDSYVEEDIAAYLRRILDRSDGRERGAEEEGG